ncbi:Hypothetical protein A7982_07077 [Minicystis rosea]|nr:Hypothetical protein A7982_07077 [Minicystis rosea]
MARAFELDARAGGEGLRDLWRNALVRGRREGRPRGEDRQGRGDTREQDSFQHVSHLAARTDRAPRPRGNTRTDTPMRARDPRAGGWTDGIPRR